MDGALVRLSKIGLISFQFQNLALPKMADLGLSIRPTDPDPSYQREHNSEECPTNKVKLLFINLAEISIERAEILQTLTCQVSIKIK